MSNATRMAICVMALIALAAQGHAAPITFGSASDFTNNFVQTLGDVQSPAWDWNSGGFIRSTFKNMASYPANTVGGGHDAFLYKPGGNNILLDNFTVALDFRTSATDGVSVYFGGGASLAGKLFGQARVDAAATNDRSVFFSGRSMDNSVNVGGTNLGPLDFNTTVAPGNWYHFVFEVDRTSPTAVSATLSVYDGATLKYQDVRAGLSDANTAGSWIGLNFFKLLQGDYVDIDNVQITDNDAPQPPVPEPATLALVGTGALGLLGFAIRRRMKR